MLPVSISRCSRLALLISTRISETQQFTQFALRFRDWALPANMCQLLCFLLHLKEG